MKSHRLERCFDVFLIALALLVVSSRAEAQVAPTGGHYAAQPSDSGFSRVGPDAVGKYTASIPLQLPPIRGDIPIPFQIVSGGRGFGAAGVGWDIPLSYVLVDASIRHRRPADLPNATPQARIQYVVSLFGQQIDMVRKGTSETDWVARRDNTTLLLRRYIEDAATGRAAWKLFDGEGRVYLFRQPVGLGGTGLYLLSSISKSGNSVALDYGIGTGTLPNSQETAVTITIGKVAYNGRNGCYKDMVTLRYDDPSPAPLAMSILGQGVLARYRKLVGIDISRRCDVPETVVRKYKFNYADDADTKLPRLSSVEITGGRKGTAEENTSLPVASYTYGSATFAGTLRYEQTQTVAMPVGVHDPTGIATTQQSDLSTPYSSHPTTSTTSQALTDVTGDGRPDLVYSSGDQLWVARNRPAPLGTTTIGVINTQVTDAQLTKGPFETRSASQSRFSTTNSEYTWRQAIDVNGDGRVDIIDASEEKDHWVVYLNTPNTNAAGITWVRRSYDIRPLYQHFVERNLKVYNGYLPLSHRTSGRDAAYDSCWVRDGSNKWTVTSVEYCNYVLQRSPPLSSEPKLGEADKTFIEWEVRDVNGDGYPDVVFNSASMGSTYDCYSSSTPFVRCSTEEDPSVQDDSFFVGRNYLTFGLPWGVRLQVEAVLNVDGIFINNADGGDRYPFSAPVTLETASACGVEEWYSNFIDDPRLDDRRKWSTTSCALGDINGDGLVDRIQGSRAYLGKGIGFGPATIDLPSVDTYWPSWSAYAVHESWHYAECDGATTGGVFVPSMELAGFRDLTGDGIPDYVYVDNPYDRYERRWKVAIGTGTGFAVPIPIVSPFFALSHESELCNGTLSTTTSGLYDLDGDGKPEPIAFALGRLNVYQLKAGSVERTPEAGRIVSVDNGYGAVTNITYRSAKEDALTAHQVPFPEIVVDSVTTTGTKNLGGSLSTVRYAYGGAAVFYDPALDMWRFPGYQRTVEMPMTVSLDGQRATVTDAYASNVPKGDLTTSPLEDFSTAMSMDQRFGRYLRIGRPRDTTVLAGLLGSDAWGLLAVNETTDSRRISGTHYEYTAKVIPEVSSTADDPSGRCFDIMYPYDSDISIALNFAAIAFCSAHGFAVATTTETWHGKSAPPSDANVAARTDVLEFDDIGRPKRIYYTNDKYDFYDDICVDIKYAEPTGSQERVLTAPSERTVKDCVLGSVYTRDTFRYDGLSTVGKVGKGYVTHQSVETHPTDNPQTFTVIDLFDAIYNDDGNLTQRTRRRAEDGATQVETFEYDFYGQVPLHVTSEATGTPKLESFVTIDPITSDVLTSKDANGTEFGTTYDGFGRAVLATVKPPGGAKGALLQFSYLGFDGGVAGRRITTKVFSDAVDPVSASAAPGRTATDYFDELGRLRYRGIELGADYSLAGADGIRGTTDDVTQTLIASARSYDGLGRVVFEADTYPSTQNSSTAYGTTSYFNADGTPSCTIRGRGPQAFSKITDEATERYPTCVDYSYALGRVTTVKHAPDSLLAGSPQMGLTRHQITGGTGQAIARFTVQNGTTLEYASFGRDRLGNLTSVVRYQDPSAGDSSVTWTWRFDSLGRVLRLTEPGVAPQTREYSSWGEVISTKWTPALPELEHSIVDRYDARGRLVHREERNNNLADPETIADFQYDVPQTPTALMTPRFVLGRLAVASTPTGNEYLGYDEFGRVNGHAFTSQGGDLYVEKHTFRGDGVETMLELDLPDTNWRPERVEYTYDTAARLKRMAYTLDNQTQTLYAATSIDEFGRLRSAQFGNTNYAASYADLGRRLFQSVTLSSMAGSRSISVPSYDPIDRDLTRSEVRTGLGATPNTNFVYTYDPLGRLAMSVKASPTATLSKWMFSYDPIGNITTADDRVGTNDVTLSYSSEDADRIASVTYGIGAVQPVSYDSFGSIIDEPTRTGRNHLTYFHSGQVRSIDNLNGTVAQFRYDAFGGMQKLDIVNGTMPVRTDRNYGDYISTRYQTDNGHATSYTARKLSAPGITMSRRGAGGPWIYALNEARGNRFMFNASGTFTQNLDYEPYGETTSTLAQQGTLEFTTEQWNGGDALAPFGLVQLGARVYDPVLGRFLSRDPLLVPRTAATSNPYAFAMNDPQNRTDPTGLDPCATATDPGLCISAQYNGGSQLGQAVAAGIAWAVGFFFSDGSGISGSVNGGVSIAGESTNVGHDSSWTGTLSEAGAWVFTKTNPLLSAAEYVADFDWTNALGLPGYAVREISHAIGEVQSGNTARLFEDKAWEVAEVAALELGMRAVSWARPAIGRLIGGISNAPACEGGACTWGECFAEGTPVHTKDGERSIENVEVGSRIRTIDDRECDHGPRSLVQIELTLHGSIEGHATLLRAEDWVQSSNLESGTKVQFTYSELGVIDATVERLTSRSVAGGDGCIVTGTVRHTTQSLLAISLSNGERLQLTHGHPLYVQEAHAFVAAEHLHVGDHLLAENGREMIVTSKDVVFWPQSVYNLEVDTTHTYLVGHAGVISHNGCGNTDGPKPARGTLAGDTTFADPDPRIYKDGGTPDRPVRDHNLARALRGHPTDPDNIDLRAWSENAQKGGHEGNYLRLRKYYEQNGLTREQAEWVLESYLRWIRTDVHATPVDPAKLDKLGSP